MSTDSQSSRPKQVLQTTTKNKTMPTTIPEVMEEKMKLNQASVASSDDLIKSWIHDCALKVHPHQLHSKLEEEIEALIAQLQDFVCNGSNSLKPPVSSPLASLCGALFEKGECMYYCKDCPVEDSTYESSILCETCFFGSEHRFHNYDYRACTLIGKFCDCGDPQSWTNFPFCSIHDLDMDKPAPAPLPEDVINRAKAVFQAVLEYAFDLLSMESASEVSELEELEDAQYSVVALFRRCNFSEYVSRVLPDKTPKYEIRYAFTDPRFEAQGVILTPASLESCKEIKAKIATLNPTIENSKVVYNQILAMKLLDWLNDFISKYQQLRAVLANLALDTSTFHKIITKDNCLWKASRIIWVNLIKSAMLVSDQLKSSLAEHLVVNYGSLAREFYSMTYSEEHVYDHYQSALSLTRSFLVEESLTRKLISHQDLLFVLVNTFVTLNSRSGKMDVTSASLGWTQFIIDDLKLVLSVFKPKEDDWTDQLLRAGFVKGVSQFLELLNGVHSDSDMDDKVANNLNNLLCPISNLIADWCTSDEIFNEILQKVLEVFESCNKLSNNGNKVVKVARHEASCVEVQTEKQLNRLPLSRLLANLVLNSKSFFDLSMKKYLLEIVEPSLIIQATAAVTKASKPIDSGPMVYCAPYNRIETMEKDVLLLQVGAVLLQDTDEFLIRALDKFDLVDWTRDDYETCFINQSVNLETIVGLVDEFLEMLIKLIEDRYVVGLSELTKDECLKHNIVANRGPRKRTLLSITNVQLTSSGEFRYENIIKHQLRSVAECNPIECKKLVKKLPRLTKKFDFLVDILQCDVMIHLIKTIFTRKLDLESTSFSESHLIKILHIIELALQEQESNYYSEFFSFTKRADKHQIFDLLERIEKTVRRTDPNKKLLNSLMDKYKVLAARSTATMSQEG